MGDYEHYPTAEWTAELVGLWQKIETARKDGTEILVAHLFEDGSASMDVASWWVSCWAARGQLPYNTSMVPLEYQPTHWMPLPSPPESAA